MNNPKCVVCGRFVSWYVDQGVPFGRPHDYEPPEPEFFCESCVEKQKKRCLRLRYVPSFWIPAKWHDEVAIELGFVRAGPKGAAWAKYFPPEKVPEDYKIYDYPERVKEN